MLPLLLAAVTLGPLQGVPLTGATGLQLLVSGPRKAPFVYDVDRHRVTPVRGITTKSRGLYWVITVSDSPSGPLAVLERDCRSCQRRLAYRIAADGTAHRVPLSRLPPTRRESSTSFPLPGGSTLARSGQTLALVAPDGERTPVAWPSILTWFGGVQVEPGGAHTLVTFADPAWNDGPSQAEDAYLLDAATGRFSPLPAFPALVDLKSSDLRWLPDGRLAFLGRSVDGPGILALWRPGEPSLAVRRVRLPWTGTFAVF
jgi:hypothetical protein